MSLDSRIRPADAAVAASLQGVVGHVGAPADVRVPVQHLVPGPSPRARRIDPGHVERLAESRDDWPPVLVQRAGMRVIDGHHRVEAAKRLGMSTLLVEFFDGSDEDAEIEAIRRNATHGLPLSLSERRTAAEALLHRRPDWSDRLVAEICALSATTVGRLRNQLIQDGCESTALAARLGRDGRARPIDRQETRRRIALALSENPDASLRAIAGLTNTSPATVRDVKRGRFEQHLSLVESASVGERPATSDDSPRTQLHGDAAFTSTSGGLSFATWFASHCVEECELVERAMQVPLSRVYEVIDEVHRRQAVWEAFAHKLRQRTARARP